MSKHYVNLDKAIIKLEIISESTIVDEKNRRVIHVVEWILRVPELMKSLLRVICKDGYDLYGRAKGVAVCHPEDKFDIEIGKKMARAMAESNAYCNATRRISRRLRRLATISHQMSNMGIDFIIKSNDIAIHNKEYQDSLINK